MIMANDTGARSADSREEPMFAPGDLVHHRRYGYRGVVVAVDRTCQATAAWYGKNNTQPNRNQPWYHVLVDGGAQTTYGAQTSLELDMSDEPVTHPWLGHFFLDFVDGRYQRNDEPWPESGA